MPAMFTVFRDHYRTPNLIFSQKKNERRSLERQREKSEAEKLARRTARLLAMRRFFGVHTRIATLVTNVASKVAQRYITV